MSTAAPISAAPPCAVQSVVPRARAREAPARVLDADSYAWWVRLHSAGPVRDCAITELYERLRCEARFHIRVRVAGMSEFPRSDLDDLAVQAAGDALLAVLRKLDDYRGDSQFWTWTRRFAQLEAGVSIRRRMGRDHLADDPERAFAVPDPGCSPQEHAEIRDLLRKVSDSIIGQLTTRQRAVLTAVVINGTSPATLAFDFDTTPGAIYTTLHDARKKLTAHLALCGATLDSERASAPAAPHRIHAVRTGRQRTPEGGVTTRSR
jgi:RNA polymerase sigma-70 factor (ECF subfamily)